MATMSERLDLQGATLTTMQRRSPRGVPNVQVPLRKVNVEGDPYENNWKGVGISEEKEYDIPIEKGYAHNKRRNGKRGLWKPHDEVDQNLGSIKLKMTTFKRRNGLELYLVLRVGEEDGAHFLLTQLFYRENVKLVIEFYDYALTWKDQLILNSTVTMKDQLIIRKT